MSKRTVHNGETLCWKCANNTGRCSWSHSLTPVEGWEAIPTKVKCYGRPCGDHDSFHVVSCPQFIKHERGR